VAEKGRCGGGWIISGIGGVKEDDGGIYANDKGSTGIRSKMKIGFY